MRKALEHHPSFRAGLLLLLLLVFGCAPVPKSTLSNHLGETGSTGRCAEFFAELDRAVREANVRDAGTFRVRGYPYLRTNRFLASFRPEIEDRTMFATWLDRLQELDRRARGHEIDNLPSLKGTGLDSVGDRFALKRRVAECGDVLRETDCADARERNRIRQRVQARNEYILSRRVIGGYPLIRYFVLMGVEDWREEARRSFSPEPPSGNERRRYAPRTEETPVTAPPALVRRAPRDALGIPVYSRRAKEALFRYYAPIWEVATETRADRIGTPVPKGEEEIRIDTERPVTFTRLSLTRFGDSVLTQLNYVVWFPARPETGCLDLYGGFLDGLNYRVTLDEDGKPLLYETIHNCGCYHRHFPTQHLRPRKDPGYAERPLVLSAPEMDHASMRMVVSLANGTHYVEHLYGVPRDGEDRDEPYSLAQYGRLRSLPEPDGGSRSLFGEDGIVSGSERLERVLLWPMGVLSPGAMRQWGRHPVSLVGKRHFDDPRLLERIFRRAGDEP